MSTDIVTELLVPKEHLDSSRLELVLRALLGAGFAFAGWSGQSLDAGGGVVDARPGTLADALRAHESAGRWWQWGVLLRKPLLGEDASAEVSLSVTREWPASDRGPAPFLSLQLGTLLPLSGWTATFTREFYAWSRLLADLAQPWYGRGNTDIALFEYPQPGSDTVFWPPSGASVAALEPQGLHWLNVFGPAYVERLGAERLLAAPAWRCELLAYGGIAVTLSADPREYDQRVAEKVASHLRLPMLWSGQPPRRRK